MLNEYNAQLDKGTPSVTRELQMVVVSHNSPGDARRHMVCSACEGSLVAGEIRDRDGATFIVWQCPQVHGIQPEPKRMQGSLWGSLRPASPILVPALIAVATMLLSL